MHDVRDEEVVEGPDDGVGRSRRGMLAAAGGVVGAAVIGSLATATPADATQGSAALCGLNNSENIVTTFTNQGSGAGVAGVGIGPAAGVVGTGGSTNGPGVDGTGTAQGPGVKGTGGTTSGPGVSGTGGTPNGIGVLGTGLGTGAGVSGTGGSSSGTGVVGKGGGTGGTGVRGTAAATGGNGVIGIGSPSGAAVVGENLNGADGVLGTVLSNPSQGHAVHGVSAGLGAAGCFEADGAQLLLGARFGPRPAPTLDAVSHVAGELIVDGAGDLWYCPIGGTPGTWRRLAGGGTAGALNILPAPVRVYDSRPGTLPGTGPKTPLPANTPRTLDVTLNNSGVPASATGVSVTLLLVNTVPGNGNFTIWANGQAKPFANAMVWGGSTGRFSSPAITAVDATGKCQVQSSIQTDFVLDIVGFYR